MTETLDYLDDFRSKELLVPGGGFKLGIELTNKIPGLKRLLVNLSEVMHPVPSWSVTDRIGVCLLRVTRTSIMHAIILPCT